MSSRYYIWASESCDNLTDSAEEALRIYGELIKDGHEEVYIVDENNRDVSIEMLISMVESKSLSTAIELDESVPPVLSAPRCRI